MIENFLLGFSTVFILENLFYCFLGVFVGTIIGMIPGLGPMATLSILLPFTVLIGNPIGAIIAMAGIYYGAQYGGSTTAILLKIPGEPSSIFSMIDGNILAEKGRAGHALAIAALSSFVAGTIATIFMFLIAAPASQLALKFGPTEFSVLIMFSLLLTSIMVTGNFLKSVGVLFMGFLFSTVGTEMLTGEIRYTFGVLELIEGFNAIVVIVAMIGISDIIYKFIHKRKNHIDHSGTISSIYPDKQTLKDSIAPTLRGTFIGSILGLLPGVGPIYGASTSWFIEKVVGKNKHKIGQGTIEGVAGPEAANNAAAQTGFIPALSLGIPLNPQMVLLLGVLIMNNIKPGPQVMTQNPELFWGLIVSMWVGNFILLILNWPLIKLWVKILEIPSILLYPLIILSCIVGAYYVNHSYFDVWLLLPFALFGYVLRRLNCDPIPFVMGFVLGDLLETYLTRALFISNGNWMIFLQSSLSLTIIGIGMSILIIFLYFRIKNKSNLK